MQLQASILSNLRSFAYKDLMLLLPLYSITRDDTIPYQQPTFSNKKALRTTNNTSSNQINRPPNSIEARYITNQHSTMPFPSLPKGLFNQLVTKMLANQVNAQSCGHFYLQSFLKKKMTHDYFVQIMENSTKQQFNISSPSQ